MVSEADPVVANEVANLFPDYPEKMTQQRWKNFRAWVNSDMGEPIRSICRPWCEEMRQIHLVCRECRGEDAILVDSDSNMEVGTSDADSK
ncbi:hypothetical protein FRX31_019004 [Thalictrum thalictroides]|uniref:Uncharacterized protein n=1 Tax=Thalictrum thalictroides TaxID=46969 RepID=A0A7J6W202_THATH|nr:hypothetical protein FRX31_019004 [Thalictrum thalictroides]